MKDKIEPTRLFVLHVKYPSLLMDRQQMSFVDYTFRVLGVEFQENPLNEVPNSAVKALCSLCEVPYIADRSQSNVPRF
jgi:hypothetical protein